MNIVLIDSALDMLTYSLGRCGARWQCLSRSGSGRPLIGIVASDLYTAVTPDDCTMQVPMIQNVDAVGGGSSDGSRPGSDCPATKPDGLARRAKQATSIEEIIAEEGKISGQHRKRYRRAA